MEEIKGGTYNLHVKIPPDLALALNSKAKLEGRRRNAMVTVLLCEAVGMDPAQFGLNFSVLREPAGAA